MSRTASRWVSVLVWVASFLSLAAAAHGASAPPTVGLSTRHGKSGRLADYRMTGPVQPGVQRQIPNKGAVRKGSGFSSSTSDPVAQRRFGLSQPQMLVQFEGASDDDNAAVNGGRTVPPDTEGDVGPDHYLQYINSVATIYDKNGTIVLGPLKGNAFWAGLGGPCEIQNDGDPVTRYDRQADRWVVSQFALPNFPNGPFYQCFAVSTTNDPTGEYWQYEFETDETFFTDYGKLGVWPDAYYMSFNMFGPLGEVQGGAYAFDRDAMLTGAPAGMIIFDSGNQVGLLPSDLDGPTPPPAGSPNYFMTFDVNPSRLLQWQFHVDWATPANSTFTGPVEIPVADFIYPVCDADRGQCVPQLDSPEKLETLSHTLMWRLVYRNFGDHESLLVTHTVGTADGSAAPRWYELRSPGDSPVVHQQGTYAPDASFRWMGSIAMDGNGNIALGYSKSSATMYPSIGITGRLAGDPLGTMGAEDLFIAGGGSQVDSFSRWGDYSTMSIDPVDDCTFWYTQEYYAETASFDFKTRVGAFRFPSCTNTAALEGTVTDGTNPVSGALVTATPAGDAPTGPASTATTDASGRYQFLALAPGTYDVAVSKYGFVPAVASGVVVSAGEPTVQDFTLQPLPSVLVVGTVKDASGQGWPLYARLVVSGPTGFPETTLYSDPVTGYYSIQLLAGSYHFAVTSLVPGYEPGGGPLTVAGPPSAPAAAVANWSLAVSPTCTAPGYGAGAFVGPLALSEGFDGGVIPAGWSVDTVSGVSWKIYTGVEPCFIENRTGGSGPYAMVNSGCEGPADTFLVTPTLDLSGRTSAAIQWANDYITDQFEPSVVSVDVSDDGGSNWTNVWTRESDVPGPGYQIVDMSFAAGGANVAARFHYQGFFSRTWQVDDVKVGSFACAVTPGGLVVGTVSDANSGAGLAGAAVENLSDGGSTTSFATPGNAGFYSLFADGGSKSFKASLPTYESVTRNVTVVPGSTTRLDFALPAGSLNAAPRPLQAFVAPGTVQDLTLTLTNTGTSAGSFVIQEIGVPPAASASSPVSSGPAVQRPAPTDAPELTLANAGEVVSSFPTGLEFGYGLVYDTSVDRLWVANPYYPDFGINGDGLEHQYLPDGTDTGETIDIHDTGGIQQADGTYNGRTGMLWQVNNGGDNCLFEMNPVTKVVTGSKICGPWTDPQNPVSQRALAYDYATDTYYVGSTNSTVIYHIDSAGNPLGSADLGLPAAGLAYNPTTRHLFLLTEFPGPWDIWVVAPYEDYAVLGGFRVTSGGVPVLQFGALSLEADCAGRLWLNDRGSQTVYSFESGETGWCVNDIPWLSEDPVEGTVSSSSSLPVTVTFDAQGLLPGLRQGSLIFATDTPTPVAPVPVDFTILFNDVPQGSFAWNFIYGAAGAGVMPGCAPQAPAFNFCPAEVVTRRSMAGFIERAVHGALTPPPVYLGQFQDVLAGSFNANYIQGLVDDGITAGCSVTPPLYCPDVPVTRAQMAVFVWKALMGDEPPPACTGVFNDVPCPGGFAVDYIEGIAAEGITAGCGGGDYCPDQGIPNAQMAVFLVKAFGLPVLP